MFCEYENDDRPIDEFRISKKYGLFHAVDPWHTLAGDLLPGDASLAPLQRRAGHRCESASVGLGAAGCASRPSKLPMSRPT
jgi:hypothetical protein